jgi:hypothetical protein
LASRRLRRTKSFTSYLGALTQDLQDIKNSASAPITVDNFSIGSESLDNSLVLNNKSIESASYVEGVSGWKIDGTGVAEFSDVFVRGDINAYSGTIGYWNISNPDVVRRIGNRDLYGTFLESSDLGASDYNKDSGTYVGLYKSYIDEEVTIVSASRKENVVTAVCPGHRFKISDLISVTIADDVTMSTGESAVRVIEANYNNFKYIAVGADVTELTGENYSGTAILNNKDVAGLYLQDYGKALFDYGYFSNEGVAYVSAETPNLVYNPSFEYITGNTNQFSSASWFSETSTVTSYEYSVDDIYNGDSFLGGQIGWTTTGLSTYLHAQVNESEFKRLDFYKNNRELYLNFDMFFKFPISKVAIPTTDSFVTTSPLVITITCPGHGLAVDDLVYFDFTVGGLYYGFRIHTVLSVSGDSFTVPNMQGTTAESITLSRYATESGPVIFKYTQPVFDLSEIKISFVTAYDISGDPILDSTTSLEDVLADVTAADWEDYRYWSHSVSDFENWYFYTDLYSSSPLYRPISSMGIIALNLLDGDGSTKQLLNIKLSSSKIESFYRKLAPNSYNSSVEFYISFPQWMWYGTYSDSLTAPTKRNVKVVSAAGVGYILDNVSISPDKKFFFGDSGSSSFYYKLAEGDADQAKTSKVSYEAPRQWLDIDLDFQTAQFKYIDSIEFKSSDFLKQLYINPNINTIKSFSTVFGGGNQERILIGESSTLNISSGQYRYLDEGNVNYRTIESFSSQETGNSSAIYQIKAVSSAAKNPNSYNSSAGGLFRVSVDTNDLGSIYGDADSIQLRAFSDKVVIDAVGYNNGGNYSRLNLVSSGLVILQSSLTQTRFEMNGGSGAGFFQESNNSMVFGLTNESPSRISAAGVLNNELTSGYQTVYLHTSSKLLGYVSSSITTKKNVEPLQLSIDSILAAEPVQFNYKSEENGSAKHAGFIAEQLVEAGLGGYVSFDEDGVPKTVNYEMFVSALQSVVRHQAAQLADLTSRLEALEGS